MVRLEEITVGATVAGIAGNDEPVRILAVERHGGDALEIVYKDVRGQLGSRLIYREEAQRLGIGEDNQRVSFDADAERLRLASEAYRISLAYIFDPYLAVRASDVVPLPHQISAVYGEMLHRVPLRYILADDPGAGKTIMTGLLLKELLTRGVLKRCMIVSPGSLAEQWQEELYNKFDLRFEILTPDRMDSAVTGNVFAEVNHCIARLDVLSRNEAVQNKLYATEWDLIVCDEAHKMSATVSGGDIKPTKRFRLGRELWKITENFLLLTATPHNGKAKDFQAFMSLVDPDRFEGAARNDDRTVDVSDVMRRLVKEDLLKFDGKRLFPERIAKTVNYELSDNEKRLYDKVTSYVQNEFERADKIGGGRKNTVGFALTVLQRRLASSPEAIYQSLKRRRERLEERLANERNGTRTNELIFPDYVDTVDYDDYDDDDMPSAESEEREDAIVTQASAALTVAELEAEIATLTDLEREAKNVRNSREDKKWSELSSLLQDDGNMRGKDGLREKLIIFTEHRDTLGYLEDAIRQLIGDKNAVVTIHGGMSREKRREIEVMFKQYPETRILIATDAAGEGINLQQAHLMINYDLPWNPNRIEQRFGRIHRIGQTEVCRLWNLVSRDTREGMVFHRLFEKLEQVRNALGGKVFDVLGEVTFDNKPLRDLLIEAIRYGNDPVVRERMNETVDNSLNLDGLKKLLAENALTPELRMDADKVNAIREDMERMEARKLQPHFIKEFFLQAFPYLGGTIHRRENERYEITSVPVDVRNRAAQAGTGKFIPQRYDRVCFDRPYRNVQDLAAAELIAPGHPLLSAVIDLVMERNADALKRGAVFIDESDFSADARHLFYIEDAVQDGNKRVISKHIHFVEIKEDGSAVDAGHAPYLDYRPATETEKAALGAFIENRGRLNANVEAKAVNHAVSQIIPVHFAEVKKRKTTLIEKTANAVSVRLQEEIHYWDFKAGELKKRESAGGSAAKLNSQKAEARANELYARKKKRLAELEMEKNISAAPPVIVGRAIVIPLGLINKLTGNPDTAANASARREIELAAMNAVMNIEKSLGYAPKDVSAEKIGYDVESAIPQDKRAPDGAPLRFIEVKGRAKGANTVTVTKNEILTALNKPDEYILAIVEVDGNSLQTAYLKKPFRERPDFATTSVNYGIAELMGGAEIILRRGDV